MIRFRRLTEEDFPLLYRWLNTDHVRQWWGTGFSCIDQVEEKYRDYPDYERAIGVTDIGSGLDLCIGETSYLYQGWGPRILTAFLGETVFSCSDVTSCVVGPAMSNTSAIRAYEKAGFRSLRIGRIPDEEEPRCVMQIDRANLVRK